MLWNYSYVLPKIQTHTHAQRLVGAVIAKFSWCFIPARVLEFLEVIWISSVVLPHLFLKVVNSTPDLVFLQLLPHIITEEQKHCIQSISYIQIEGFIDIILQKVFICMRNVYDSKKWVYSMPSIFKVTLNYLFKFFRDD